MFIQIANAEGVVLDYLAAKAQGHRVTLRDNGAGLVVIGEGHHASTDQEVTAALIDSEGIETYPHRAMPGYWAAGCNGVVRYGCTRAQAVWRSFLCWKLEEQAEVPDDLVRQQREAARARNQTHAPGGAAAIAKQATSCASGELPQSAAHAEGADVAAEMVVIQVSQAEGEPLDWLVGTCLGRPPLKRLQEALKEEGALPYCFDLFHDIKTMDECEAILAGKPHRSGMGAQELRDFAAEMGYVIDLPSVPAYSRDWALGGPLKSLKRIGTHPVEGWRDGKYTTWWCAGQDADTLAQQIYTGDTELIAAMRCIVSQDLGREALVPAALLRDEQRAAWEVAPHDASADRPRPE